MSNKKQKETYGAADQLFIKRDNAELVKGDLAECLELCGDLLLDAICIKNGMEPVGGSLHEQKRAFVRAELAQRIPVLFEQKIPFLQPEHRRHLDQAIQYDGQSILNGDMVKDDFVLSDTLVSLGVLYLCYTGEEAAIYMPTELKKLYVGKREQMKETWQRHDQMWFYARSLLNLYGTYDSGWYTQVWNQHNKNKITVHESEEYLYQLWNLQDEGWFSEGFMVSSYFKTPDMLDSFLNMAADVLYYMPNKRDILYYFDHQFEEGSVYWDKLFQLLTDWKKGAAECDASIEIAMDIISWACVIDAEEVDILDQLEGMGIVFQEPDTEKRFLTLCKGMSMNTRKWTLCGWRPVDLN